MINDLAELIDRNLDGSAAAEDVRRLDELLRHDQPGARRCLPPRPWTATCGNC